MKSVEYSQLVKRKLLKLKRELIGEYGEEKTKEILTAMADHVDMLGQHEESGVSISRMYSDFLTEARDNGFDVTNIEISKNKHIKSGELNVVLTLESQIKRTQEEMLAVIGNIEGVSFIEKL